ncbi:MAG: nucleotide pyrophosphohydrolase [Candidatus Bathyarchaeota archaeon]|nr:MAG: nucleotide pyrophosphohydrolase [Candidatus Bathyarchaeota archaeon]
MLRNDGNTVVEELIASVREFIRDRDWKQFHNPKNLAESICIEAAELLQLFQWTSSEETDKFKTAPDRVARIKEELADVIIYCLSMANAMKIDVARSVMKKLESNKKKYPVSQYKGKAPCARGGLT